MTDDDGTVSGDVGTHETDALLSRLRLIEDQPLDTRADAYAHVHEQLQSELEGGDTHR